MTLTQSIYLASLRQLSHPDHRADTVDVLTDILSTVRPLPLSDYRDACSRFTPASPQTTRALLESHDRALQQRLADRTYVDSLRLVGRR
jgi:hypothetical protein